VVNMAGGVDLSETGLISTTAEGGAGAADSATVVYSTTARSSLAYRALGYIESTQATAGTWATAPSTIQGQGGQNIIGAPRMQLVTPVATTSGTSVDFTSIPSWVKKITVMFNSVSTNGTSLFLVQIGSGSVETTGYVSGAGGRAGETTSTAGFVLNPTGSAGSAFSGHNTITLLGSNLWVSSGILPRAGTGGDGFGNVSAGTKTTAGTLDRLRFTTAGGTDTFDLGSVNLLLEG
jgi:hypothetical protein